MMIEAVFNSGDAPPGDATARDLRGRIVGRVGARFRGALVIGDEIRSGAPSSVQNERKVFRTVPWRLFP
jgi:hypothetical protein